METEALKTFVEVVRTGSFAAVARRLDVDPSSVSRVIAVLEAQIGFRLFQRTTRHLAPTEAGALYFERILPLLEGMEQANTEARDVLGEPRGRLRVTASVAFGTVVLVPILPRLRAAYPGLGIDLILTDAVIDIIAEKVDIAIRLGQLSDNRLVSAKLMPTRYRAVASPSYLKRASQLRRPSDLSSHDCLVFPLPGYRSHWKFRDKRAQVSEVPIKGTVSISNSLALRRAALDGLGPALLANWLVDPDIHRKALVELFPRCEASAQDFDTAAWIVYPSRAYVPRKVRVFIDFLKAEISLRK